jgi:hypothetical protein
VDVGIIYAWRKIHQVAVTHGPVFRNFFIMLAALVAVFIDGLAV